MEIHLFFVTYEISRPLTGVLCRLRGPAKHVHNYRLVTTAHTIFATEIASPESFTKLKTSVDQIFHFCFSRPYNSEFVEKIPIFEVFRSYKDEKSKNEKSGQQKFLVW